MHELPDVTNIPHKELRPLIEKVRERVKKHPVVKKIFKKYKVDINEFDLVPICFANLDVSARTDHAVIYLNINLLKDGDLDMDDHYFVHEVVHWLQQTTGKKPTQGANEGSYLDNKYEIEGFQTQTEYLADTRDDQEAENYVEQVLDHHEVFDDKERNRRKRQLFRNALINDLY